MKECGGKPGRKVRGWAILATAILAAVGRITGWGRGGSRQLTGEGRGKVGLGVAR